MKFDGFSPGSFIIGSLALFSSIAIFFMKDEEKKGQAFWLFSTHHAKMYREVISEWNKAQPSEATSIDMNVISYQALERRLLSGFLSDTIVPDLAEVEINMASRFFSGPIDAIGFSDLTDRILAEGLDKRINGPSFSPWKRDGRIYGLPHDMHPVLLGYRADIIEAAGIDMSQIETWDDFIRILSPLMVDKNGDGEPDRYLLDLWETDIISTEILLLQAGGRFFDELGRSVINNPINTKVLSNLVIWVTGETRIGASIPRFDAGGNQARLDGYVLCHLLPDWYAGVIQKEIPSLGGKLKLMKLPAWEQGGRRTSALGGTMLSIPKRTEDPDAAWNFAKKLYLDERISQELYDIGLIVSPVKDHWDKPFYKKPIPFYSNQPIGELYLEVAPEIPARQPSPFLPMAKERLTDAFIRIKREAINRNLKTVEEITPFAQEELDRAQAYLESKISRNQFINTNPTDDE